MAVVASHRSLNVVLLWVLLHPSCFASADGVPAPLALDVPCAQFFQHLLNTCIERLGSGYFCRQQGGAQGSEEAAESGQLVCSQRGRRVGSKAERNEALAMQYIAPPTCLPEECLHLWGDSRTAPQHQQGLLTPGEPLIPGRGLRQADRQADRQFWLAPDHPATGFAGPHHLVQKPGPSSWWNRGGQQAGMN